MEQRKIIHIDMDAFYASVEQRDHPEYRGRPLAVGRPEGRGVVAAASYEARRYGIRSAMPSVTARRLCPELIFIPGRMEVYREVSRQIHRIFREYTDLVEPIAFELLPRKFTLRQLQVLYEAILGIEIDNRNFRKKVLSSGYLRETGEREKHVAHKPAMFYSFDKGRFQKDVRQKFRLNFINWQL